MRALIIDAPALLIYFVGRSPTNRWYRQNDRPVNRLSLDPLCVTISRAADPHRTHARPEPGDKRRSTIKCLFSRRALNGQSINHGSRFAKSFPTWAYFTRTRNGNTSRSPSSRIAIGKGFLWCSYWRNRNELDGEGEISVKGNCSVHVTYG